MKIKFVIRLNKMNRHNFDNMKVQHISNEIWHIFDSLKSSTPIEDLHIILFLLSGYKDGILNHLKDEYNDLNFDLINCYNREQKYSDIVEVYSSIIKYIPRHKLSEILFALNRIPQDELREFFPEVFDSILYRLSNAQGKNSGEFIQPFEISRLIMNLANLKNNDTVYNPFAGLASFATFLNSSQRYYGQEINHKTWALGTLRLMAYDIHHSDYRLSDSIENWLNFGEFDLIVSNPPFGIKIPKYTYGAHSSVEMFLIENSLNRLPKNGQLIAVLPQSFLHTSTLNEKRYRKYLVDNNYIDTVISLPSGILKHTSISVCIIVFKKYRFNTNIKFIDASEFVTKSIDKKGKILDDLRLLDEITLTDNKNYIRYIDNSEIQNESYNLNVSRYFINSPSNGIKLSEIGHFISGTRSERDKTIKIVKVRDLKDDILDYYLNLDSVEYKESQIPNLRKIEQDCLLVAIRWKTLRPTFFKFQEEPIYITNDIIAIKINERRVNINYLINELHSEYVTDQLNKYRINGIIPLLKREDLFSIKIELPSLEKQIKKYYSQADKYLSTKAERVNSDYNEQIINVYDENTFLRHQIAGSLKNVRGAFNFIKKIIEEQVKPQLPDLENLKANKKLETTFSNYMHIIERDLISINKAVNKVGDKIDLLDLNVEYFDLLLFIKEYAESLRIRAKNLFTIALDLDESAITEYGISAILIQADKDIVRRMLDNIIENAEKHAFTNTINSENKIKIELIYDFEDFTVQIDISNTGKPLSQNITHDSMIRKGSSSGEKSGDGVGLWFVNEVMKIHKGKFGFTDQTEPEGIDGEYVTTIELTFEIIPSI